MHRTYNLYDRILSNKPIIEKDHSKKGSDYYQTIVRYISKMEAQCTTDSLMWMRPPWQISRSLVRSKELFLRTSRTQLNEIKVNGIFIP